MAIPSTTSQKLSPGLKQAVRQYCQTHDMESVNRNLRRMLLDYLNYELRIGVPLYLEELLWQLSDLFELLDVVATETKDWHKPGEKEDK
jgi:nucleoid-associated protein YejK